MNKRSLTYLLTYLHVHMFYKQVYYDLLCFEEWAHLALWHGVKSLPDSVISGNNVNT